MYFLIPAVNILQTRRCLNPALRTLIFKSTVLGFQLNLSRGLLSENICATSFFHRLKGIFLQCWLKASLVGVPATWMILNMFDFTLWIPGQARHPSTRPWANAIDSFQSWWAIDAIIILCSNYRTQSWMNLFRNLHRLKLKQRTSKNICPSSDSMFKKIKD